MIVPDTTTVARPIVAINLIKPAPVNFEGVIKLKRKVPKESDNRKN
jgi:hypothetical protein